MASKFIMASVFICVIHAVSHRWEQKSKKVMLLLLYCCSVIVLRRNISLKLFGSSGCDVSVVMQAMNSGAGGAGVGLMPAAATATPALLPAVMSAVKRPALVDNKTGLPVYQPLPAAAGSTPYHPLSAMSLQPQARYITVPGWNLIACDSYNSVVCISC